MFCDTNAVLVRENVKTTSAGTPSPHRGLLHFMASDGAAVWFGALASVRALLHPLHHQAQQGGHCLVNVNARHCTCLKVRDADEKEESSFLCQESGASIKHKLTFCVC